jgi:hypothetical protein
MRQRDRLIKSAERGRFLVTTDTEESFEGVLVDCDESHFVLADAYSISAKGDRLKIDEHLWLPRSRIKYMQAMTIYKS